MNNAGDDIASQVPKNNIPIQKVGLIRKNIPVIIASPFASTDSSEENKKVTVHCQVQVSTFVPGDARGVHMSRMNNAFAKASLSKYSTILDYATSLATLIATSHFSTSTTVSVSTTLPIFAHVKGWKPEKDKLSLDHIGMNVSVTWNPPSSDNLNENGEFGQVKQKEWEKTMGVTVNHITACPCVQKTFAHAASLHDVQFPLLTHSQRTTTNVEVSHLNGAFDIPTLLQSVDTVVHRVQNTLPREYELAKVHDAHLNPQFAEDVVRDLTVSIQSFFSSISSPANPISQQSTIKVTSNSQESIHDFDIVAEIVVPAFPANERQNGIHRVNGVNGHVNGVNGYTNGYTNGVNGVNGHAGEH
ncbi:GTP cyclohydrolase FolE2/MptA [Paraphysoderma sedebokerense]|nr:GTP cyclohydrolase FolE2/MptA [Paraphysoderma sedebokerense]